IKTSVSLPLGAVTLSENFLQAQRPLAAELAKMAAHIKSVLAPALATMTPTPHAAIGIGGTATALAALACNLHEYDSDRIQDYRLSRASLEAIGERLNCLSGEERNRLPGLSHGRGEIIIGGLMIIKTLLEILAYQQITVSDGGLLEGILLSIANPM
ncbi:MAG: hypothetical protein OEL80_04655, partial [Desulfuromonadales bacterium]|nr:hypothetical protein [Desulfuromonadales bacterium]